MIKKETNLELPPVWGLPYELHTMKYGAHRVDSTESGKFNFWMRQKYPKELSG